MPRAEPRRRYPFLPLLLLALAGCSQLSCATLQEIAALRDVDFDLAGTDRAYLAGISLDGLRSNRDLDTGSLLRLADAVRRRSVPLDFVLHVAAHNPAENQVTARLVSLDWRLLLRGRETVSGHLREDRRLPPGGTVDVPVRIELDLWRFFEDDAQSLLDIALDAVAGDLAGIELLARPTVDTPLGPITYPNEIRITAR
jgi:hypothetical protein